MNIKNILLCSAMCLALAACGENVPDGPSKAPPTYTGVKIGEPYSIAGKWYTPREDPYYDAEGMASWYGPGFHGKKTANGEYYNQYDLTAAHPTLPMPSFVRVTNLENQRQAIVRVNDRGPFHSSRIIDLSKAAAEKLGISGISKVRVQFLKEETEVFLASKGTIWPDELQPETQVASNIMPREALDLNATQDASYNEVDSHELKQMADSHDFKPAPLEIAQNNASVSASAPILSVSTSNNLPKLIKPAMADEAPYPSALKQEPLLPPTLPTSTADVYTRDSKAKPAIASATPLENQPWSAQIASFSERKNAEKLAQKVMVIGQPELQPVLIDGKQWYRVYLHPANSQMSKEQLLAELQKMGLPDARIVN